MGQAPALKIWLFSKGLVMNCSESYDQAIKVPRPMSGKARFLKCTVLEGVSRKGRTTKEAVALRPSLPLVNLPKPGVPKVRTTFAALRLRCIPEPTGLRGSRSRDDPYHCPSQPSPRPISRPWCHDFASSSSALLIIYRVIRSHADSWQHLCDILGMTQVSCIL